MDTINKEKDMKPRIIQRRDINKQEWDKFVMESPYGWAFHLYDVIGVDRYKEDKDISFAIYDEDKGQIALIAMLHIEYKESGNLLHSRYGIVPRSGLAHKEQKKLCNAYKEYIDSLCVKYNIKRLLAGTVPIAEALQPQKKELVNPLMEYGYCPAATTPTYTWVCDINGDEEELIKKCEQTTRQALRKLEQSNKYEIIEADNNPEDYDDYVRLHIETYTRTGLADEILSDEYHRNIFNNMIPQGICRVFFLKEKEINENIASVAILVYKNTAYYWWGSSVGEKEVGINKYLLWKSMMIVKDTYYRNGGMEDNFWFETGGAYVYERKGKRKGLNDFKKSFGCQLHPIYRGEYMLP